MVTGDLTAYGTESIATSLYLWGNPTLESLTLLMAYWCSEVCPQCEAVVCDRGTHRVCISSVSVHGEGERGVRQGVWG